MTLRIPVPPALRRMASDEYRPLPWRAADQRALSTLSDHMAADARRAGLDLRSYVESRTGTAATLRAIDEAAGGGFYQVPAEAAVDPQAAAEAFASDGAVVDVQTHLVRPSRFASPAAAGLLGYLQMVDPERWGDGVNPELISAPQWASLVFGSSETRVALLTSLPSPPDDNVLTNAEIAATREIVDRYAGSGRVLTHTIVHPNLGAEELEAMESWRDQLRPSGWKVYTLWDTPERTASGAEDVGWFLDDEQTGLPFLERVRALGPRIVCSHKGIAGPIPSLAPASSSPRDVGPAAAAFPDITFLVYHSGYEPDAEGEEAEHDAAPDRGVSRLVTSLDAAGIPPNANVYAELGSTWFLMMRRPREAAHVLGKLLRAVGDERIVWGTDSIWYGSPQFLIDAFRAFTIPEWMQEKYGYPQLTREAKARILGSNAADVYGLDYGELCRSPDRDVQWLERASAELAAALD